LYDIRKVLRDEMEREQNMKWKRRSTKGEGKVGELEKRSIDGTMQKAKRACNTKKDEKSKEREGFR